MYQESDFKFSSKELCFKKDSYPLSKVNGIRVKKLSLLDNLGQIVFWVIIFSGALWLAIAQIGTVPFVLKVLAISLTVLGIVFALFRCSRYSLQIEFRHIDETGVQWITVAKSNRKPDYELFKKQVVELKSKLV